jgi:Secretion system C-terminal sorting domain/GEVED domain/MAM domain, meprin/A5/mu/Fibronectin type III domain/CUB domain
MKKITLCLSILSLGFMTTNVSAQYCTTGVGPTNTFDTNVESVALTGDATNIAYTGCPATAGVEDQTVQAADVTTGLPYTANVQFGTCGGNYGAAGEAWIDWNQNQLFEASESIGTWTGTPPVASSAFGFVPPGTAVAGATIMRVMMEEGGGLPLDPCGTYTYGSVVDFTINVTIGAPITCPFPTALTANILSGTSVDLGWTENGTATTWNIEWDTTGFAQGTGNVVAGTTTNPHNLTGLTSNTTYEFYVQADCGADSSLWVGPFSFTTPPNYCAGDPFYDNGGAAGDYSDNSNDTIVICPTNIGDIVTVTFNSFALEACCDDLTIFDGNGTGGTSFGTFTGTSPGTITSTDPSGCLTFVFTSDGSVTDAGWDATITCAPPATCLPPTALNATTITTTTADLGWTDNAGVSLWDIEWGVAGFIPTGTPSIVGTTSNPQNLTLLVPATSYDFYVRADCGGGDLSTWVGPFSFTTLIQVPQGVTCVTGSPMFVFTEEFDTAGTWAGDISTTPVDGDWIFPFSGATGSTNTGPDTAYSNNNYVYYEASGGTTDTASLVSPAIDLTTATDAAELSFWMHAYGADMSTLSVGVSTSATGPFSTVFSYTGELQTAGTDAWQSVGIDLNAYLGQIIYIEFSYYGTGGFDADMALDLVQVETCITPLGINPVSENVNLNVYPNPNKGLFTLNVNTIDVNELEIKVMNIHGQVVFIKNNFDNISNVNEQIDLSSNANGIYFVTVTSDKGIATHKVIVQ